MDRATIIERIKAKEAAIRWRQVKAMGRTLRLEYHHLNGKIIWNVERNELPDLLGKILEQNPHLRGSD